MLDERQRTKWLDQLRSVGKSALNLLYPPRCFGCGRPGEGETPEQWNLCADCMGQLEPIEPPFCQQCGETIAGAITEGRGFTCSNCDGQTHYFDFAIASYEATKIARDLVHRFKYQRQLHLRRLLGTMLGGALDDPRIASHHDWILIPVPLHAKRQREREFNQAEEIARFAAKAYPSSFSVADVLKRTRYTTQQAQLDRKERLTNLSGAFTIKARLKPQLKQRLDGGCFLLVDDVLTTGATVNECARVLRETFEPQRLAVVTVARG